MGFVKMLKIRRFKESDLDGVYETITLAFETASIAKVYEPDKFKIWHDMYTKEGILNYAKQRHMYVAVYNEKIVGCATVSPMKPMTAFVSCVYVNKNYQGMGIAHKLIEALEKDEISQKAGKMLLHAILTSKTFYEKIGFHIEESFPEIIYDTGVEVIQLVREVNHIPNS